MKRKRDIILRRSYKAYLFTEDAAISLATSKGWVLRTTIAAWGSGMGSPCHREPNGMRRGHMTVTWWIQWADHWWNGIQWVQGPGGVQYSAKVLYSLGVFPVDRSFVLNSNSISYILVTAQYFKASLGDTY
jgi:hypothetical protein